MRRYRMAHAYLLAAVLFGGGCADKQNYEVVARERGDDLLRLNQSVVEGRVSDSGAATRTTFWQYIFFWIPMGATPGDPIRHATVAVEKVLKGDVGTDQIRLQDYRPLSPTEKTLFPDNIGIHMGSVLRLGFDGSAGERLRSLRIVPLGNPPEFDAALRRSSSSNPSTSPSR